MGEFEEKVTACTTGEKPEVLGVVALAVDRDGSPLLSHTAGKTNLTPNAPAINKDSILVLASATKLLTSLAALRLVQAGKLDLDDSSLIEKHLPELCALQVLTSAPGEDIKLTTRTKPTSLRQLLTHSSGSSYDELDPRLMDWRASRGEPNMAFSGELPAAVCTPSLFQPGEGWAYGGSLDWTGMLVERISGISLSEFLRKEVFDVVGCDERIGFHRAQLSEQGGELVATVTNWEDGKLVDYPWPKVEPKSERGGGGLYSSSENYLRVLKDLIALEPKILKKEMLDVLFSPQFAEGSKPLAALRNAAPVFTSMTGALTGALSAESINHALGGILITEDNPELGKSAGTMAWGGAFNCLWFANRRSGVAGFYGSSMFPPGESTSSELMGTFVREVWKRAGEKEEKGAQGRL